MPRGNLNLAEARAACTSAGKRLCREDEWLYACTAGGQRRWPYGNVYVPDRCADRADKGGSLVSGARPDCGTPDGVLDQSGNLWEWTEGAAFDGPGAEGAESGVLHGGGWNFSAGLGQCRSRADAAADYRDPQFGARCCVGP